MVRFDEAFSLLMPIKSRIRAIPGFPRQGVTFRDITTLLKDAAGFRLAIHKLINRYSGKKIHKVAAIESRGFIVGAPLAYALGAGFVPVRKKGKLPAETIGCDYVSEYGTDRIEIHTDAVAQGERILLVDDLLATGGTAEAAYKLLCGTGCSVIECAFLVDLPSLGGRERLERLGIKVFTLVEFND
ncbi:MAG: adenine phosphoribosyltransferase [Azoarcus sp.]|nr:adenine phosphoribosyltransferase [Azoarcus sp.]